MSFAILLLTFFALLHLPPLRHLPWLATPQDRAAVAVGLFFIGAGVMHFAMPLRYEAMIPPQLPSPRFWVLLSGAFQVAGGVGMLLRRTRRLAALGLIALLLAILPANIHEARANTASHVLPLPDWYFWLRIPFQLVYVAWVAWAGGLWRIRSRAKLEAHITPFDTADVYASTRTRSESRAFPLTSNGRTCQGNGERGRR